MEQILRTTAFDVITSSQLFCESQSREVSLEGLLQEKKFLVAMGKAVSAEASVLHVCIVLRLVGVCVEAYALCPQSLSYSQSKNVYLFGTCSFVPLINEKQPLF